MFKILHSSKITISKFWFHKHFKIFQDAKFTLHKWHSNDPELESEQPGVETGNTFAKQQLGLSTDSESSLLGLAWNKEADEFSVLVPEMKTSVTKRELLRNLASIYDPLGHVAPVTLKGKTIYRDTCKAKTAWDTSLPESQAAEYSRWVREMPKRVAVPRALTTQRKAIEEIERHTFGDASAKGVCAALYAIVKQCGSTNAGLVASRARLAKQDLSIPRLELVSANMAKNLMVNVRQALGEMPVTGSYGWLSCVFAGQTSLHSQISRRCASMHVTRGSWAHYGENQRKHLGPQTKAASEEDHKGMSWVSAISCKASQQTASRKLACRSDRRRSPIPGGRRRLRRPNQVSRH